MYRIKNLQSPRHRHSTSKNNAPPNFPSAPESMSSGVLDRSSPRSQLGCPCPRQARVWECVNSLDLREWEGEDLCACAPSPRLLHAPARVSAVRSGSTSGEDLLKLGFHKGRPELMRRQIEYDRHGYDAFVTASRGTLDFQRIGHLLLSPLLPSGTGTRSVCGDAVERVRRMWQTTSFARVER